MTGVSHLRPPRLEEEAVWTAAAALAARFYGVRLPAVIDCRGKATRPANGSNLLLARKAALYLANCGANLSQKGLARASGMRGPTIRHHLAAIEDDRELKADLDALMDELTVKLRATMAAAFGDRAAA